MYLQHISKKLTASNLHSYLKDPSPGKEGGELYLPNDEIIEYGYEQPELTKHAIDTAKHFEKNALLTQKLDGLISGKLKDTRARYGEPDEYNNIMLGLSKEESQFLSDDQLKNIRETFIKTIQEYTNSVAPGSKPTFFVDHAHTDTEGYHIQARINIYAIDENNRTISEPIDLANSSHAASFSKLLKENLTTELGMQVSSIPFHAFTGATLSAGYAKSGQLARDARAIENGAEPAKPQHQQNAFAPPVPFHPEVERILNAETMASKNLTAIDAQIRALESQKQEAVKTLDDIKNARHAITQKLEAEKERDAAFVERDEAVQVATEAAAKMAEAEARAEKAEINLDSAVKLASERAIKIEELEESVKNLDESNIDLAESVADLEKSLEDLENEKNKIIAHRDQLQNEKILLEGEVEDLGEQNKTLVDQIAEASLSLEKTNQELAEAKNLNDEYAIELTTVKTQIDNFKLELQHSQQARETLLNENNGLKETIEGMKKLMEEAKQQNQEALNQMQQLNAQLSESFKAQLQQMQDMMQQSHKMQEQALLQQIEALRAEKDAAIKDAREAKDHVKSAEVFDVSNLEATDDKEYKAESLKIDNYNPVPFGDSVVYENARGYKTFIDHGNRIEIASKNPTINDIEAMLELASQKWPKGIAVNSASDDLRYKIVKIAAEHDYKILNEDLKKSIDSYKEILAKKQSDNEIKPAGEVDQKETQKSAIDMTAEERAEFLKSLDQKPENENGKDKDKDRDDR